MPFPKANSLAIMILTTLTFQKNTPPKEKLPEVI